MSSGRIKVEWIFTNLKQYWTTTDLKRKLMINQAPVGSIYLCCILLSNFRTCIYGNEVSKYFGCVPPSLDEYLSHKEQNEVT